MRAFVLLATLVAFTQGRPEPGYSYRPPSNTYGAPGHGGDHGGHGGHGGDHGGDGIFLGGGGHGINLGGGGGGGFNFGGGGGSFGLNGGSIGIGGGSFGVTGGSFGGTGIGGSVVQKHIYVHVPPPEPEDLTPPRTIPVAPAQKHYKIIFIKAPTPPTPTVPVIPLQPQNEEKTLVYVLVKKPDDVPDINIPVPQPTQPTKPEVYFIRYKTQKEGGSITGGLDISGDSGISGISGISGVSGINGINGGGILGNHGTNIDGLLTHGGSHGHNGHSHTSIVSNQYGAPHH